MGGIDIFNLSGKAMDNQNAKDERETKRAILADSNASNEKIANLESKTEMASIDARRDIARDREETSRISARLQSEVSKEKEETKRQDSKNTLVAALDTNRTKADIEFDKQVTARKSLASEEKLARIEVGAKLKESELKLALERDKMLLADQRESKNNRAALLSTAVVSAKDIFSQIFSKKDN